jgi:hypothetical protein
VLRDCTIVLGGSSAIEGRLQTDVWMSSSTLAVTLATIFFIISLSTSMLVT